MTALARFLLEGVTCTARLAIIVLVRCYQLLISPWLGPRCRFTPTCSAYLLLAVEKYGVARGCYRGLRRILHCHPWGGSGYDPP
jgi:uncharacterized protein